MVTLPIGSLILEPFYKITFQKVILYVEQLTFRLNLSTTPINLTFWKKNATETKNNDHGFSAQHRCRKQGIVPIKDNNCTLTSRQRGAPVVQSGFFRWLRIVDAYWYRFLKVVKILDLVFWVEIYGLIHNWYLETGKNGAWRNISWFIMLSTLCFEDVIFGELRRFLSSNHRFFGAKTPQNASTNLTTLSQRQVRNPKFHSSCWRYPPGSCFLYVFSWMICVKKTQIMNPAFPKKEYIKE